MEAYDRYNDTENLYASWLLLELGSQGRPAECVAQFLASIFKSVDCDAEYIRDLLSQIIARYTELMMDESAIWELLLPGGGFQHNETMTKWTRIMSGADRFGIPRDPEPTSTKDNVIWIEYEHTIVTRVGDHKIEKSKWFIDELGNSWVKFESEGYELIVPQTSVIAVQRKIT